MPPALEPCLLVQIPDKAGDESALQRRNQMAAHLSANKIQLDLNRLVVVGPTVQTVPTKSDGPPFVMNGSMMVWKGHDEDQVRSWLDENPYATSGVWDMDLASFTPFLCAVRKAM